MFYVFRIINDKVTCHGAYSLEFHAYAKKKRLNNAEPYAEIEIVERT